MNNFERFNNVVNYIEQNLNSEIDINRLAEMMGMSVYEFRRIFSFAAGVPIGEYIRKRRMSYAAEELISGKSTVTQVAFNLGYESSASFSRAFREFHGASPADIQCGKCSAEMFSKIEFTFGISGGSSISYSIVNDDSFAIDGISGLSDISDTECCENVWEKFYDSEFSMDKCNGKIYASYKDTENGVACCIGARTPCGQLEIPASEWVCFKINGSDDNRVNEFYEKILFEWLRSSSFTRRYDLPNIEIFPEDMEGNFQWEIRIPVKKR